MNDFKTLEYPFDTFSFTAKLYNFETENSIKNFTVSHRLFRIIHSFCFHSQEILKKYGTVLFPNAVTESSAEHSESAVDSGFISQKDDMSDAVPVPNKKSDKERRRAKARKLQQKRMHKMKNKSQQILASMELKEKQRLERQETLQEIELELVAEVERQRSEHSSTSKSSQSPLPKTLSSSLSAELPFSSDNLLECCICNGKDTWPDKEPRLLGLVCRIENNANLGRKISTSHEFVDEASKKFPSVNDPEISDPENSVKSSSAEKIYISTVNKLNQFLNPLANLGLSSEASASIQTTPLENILPTVPFDQFSSPNITSCGHYMHFRCFKHYIGALMGSSRRFTSNDVKIAGIDFTCPVCRQQANMLLLNYDSVPMVNNLLDDNYSSFKDLEEIYSNICSNKISMYTHNFRPQEECDALLLSKELRSASLVEINSIFSIWKFVVRVANIVPKRVKF